MNVDPTVGPCNADYNAVRSIALKRDRLREALDKCCEKASRYRMGLKELVEASQDIPEILESLDSAREPDDADVPLTAKFKMALLRAKAALKGEKA